MYHQISIQQVSMQSWIWMPLFMAIASLGIYYSVILLYRDRGRRGQRLMMGIYVFCTSILLLHLLVLLSRNGLTSHWMQIVGTIALFLVGPFSYRMMVDHLLGRGIIRYPILYTPVLLMAGLVFFELIHESLIYAIGIVYTGLWLVLQALNLRPWKMDTGHLRWNHWYTLIQISLFTGIGISCLVLNGMLLGFLVSAGLAILILLSWIRLLYIAYLSYVISKS